MAIDRLPSGLGSERRVALLYRGNDAGFPPAGARASAQHWAVLHAFEGSVTFVDLQADADRIIPARTT